MDPKLKPVLGREMEVYAAFMEHTDHHVGRLIDTLKDLEVLDDTLIYLHHRRQRRVRRGHAQGAFNEMAKFNGMAGIETPEFMMSKLDEFGGRNPTATLPWAGPGRWIPRISGPSRSRRTGAARATARSCTGRRASRKKAAYASVPPRDRPRPDRAGSGRPPRADDGQWRAAEPVRRHQHLYSFNDAKAAERHETQYFEMFCNRGIYHKGWSAVTKHRTPWEMGGAKMPAFDDDVWELYDGSTDWTQANDLSKKMPEKLHELQRLWLIEAVSTTCCRSTTGRSSASCPRWPGGRR